MGAVHSRTTLLNRSPKRWSFKRKLSCSTRQHSFRSTNVIVFFHCTTDFALQCAVKLIGISDCVVRIHATTNDYDNVKKLDDKILLEHLNKDLFLHKVNLQSEQTTKDFLFEVLDMEGSIDVLVCYMDQMNGFIGDFDEDNLTGAFETLFFPSFNVLKGIIPIFKKQKHGKVIYVNSIAGIIGLPMHSVYCSVKFAIEGLLESLASECITHGIKFTVIETALEKSPSTELQLELDSKIHDNNNIESRKMLLKITETLQMKQLLKTLNVHNVAGTIRELISVDDAHFRYATNKKCAYVIREKLLDSRGTSSIKEVSKFCFNLDLDEEK